MELDQLGNDYDKAKTYEVAKEAAGNEGVAGGFMGAGMGAGMGAALGAGMGAPPGQQQPTQQPEADPLARLEKLNVMLEKNLITQDDFDTKKKQILENI
jgi:membrane protease subunit (stomatin/prohibitin family)